jgi:hypothetical protein
MPPLWLALAIKMIHPSPRQWFGLLCGVANWIVTPGIALLLGAWPLLRTRTPETQAISLINYYDDHKV